MKMFETKNGKSYWDGNGKYQKKYEELVKCFPKTGKCKNNNLEILRCLVMLNYDLYNNGADNWNHTCWLIESIDFLRNNGYKVWKSADCLNKKIDKIIEELTKKNICKNCKHFYKRAPILNKNCKEVGINENEKICACFENLTADSSSPSKR